MVVIGLGRFGTTCARRLQDQGAEVLAIDRNRGLVERIKDDVADAIACDATQRENLEAYDVGGMDAAVVAMAEDFEASVVVTLLCKELGVPTVLAKAANVLQKRVLFEVGADEVVMPEEEMGARLADHLLGKSVVDFVELPPGYSLRRLTAPEEWVGSSLEDLRLLQRLRLNVLQVVRPRVDAEGERDPHAEDTEQFPVPDGSTVIEAGDLVDVVAPDEALRDLGG
jgi:trk system potassium uptake protein TrkA